MNLSRSVQSLYGLKTKLLMTGMALMLALASFVAVIPQAEAQTSGAVISLNSSAYRFGQSILVSGAGFAPGEKISLWFTTPSGTATDAEGGNGTYVNANNNGTFESFPVGGGNTDANNIVVASGPGTWYLTAKGNTSGRSAITSFTVVAPAVVAQGVQVGSVLVVFLKGAFFYPDEKINLWLTDGSGAVLALPYTFADRQGNMPDPTFGSVPNVAVPTSPNGGPYTLSARGATSSYTATAPLNTARAANS
jgi:hypothetical protein